MAARSRRPSLVVIVGPTASGKSDLALKIAQKFNGEIISADSWAVYKNFDIGTSKPSAADKQLVPHHLIDVAEPEKGFSAPLFKKLALNAVKSIRRRRNLPIIVGGTGLYIDSVLHDFQFLPPSNPSQRKKLNDMTLAALLKQAQVKGISLDTVDRRNKRRVIRAIESKGSVPESGQPLKNVLIVGLKPHGEVLIARIKMRTERMIADGLEQEVKELSQKYGWEIEPMKGVGYRQWHDYFAGRQSIEATIERINSATRGLVKRQLTWLKRDPAIVWFSDEKTAYEYICTQLNN